MIIDAIVLAGGRATRLDGTPKAFLVAGERSLLSSTLAAVARARRIVVVGDEAALGFGGFTVVREEPAFAGPAAGIAAGLAALDDSDFTIVVACDMPGVAAAIDVLLAALAAASDGVVAVSADGREQPLVGVYATGALRDSARPHRDGGDLEDLSVRAFLSGLSPTPVAVPDGSTDDVDTWADAARLGVVVPVNESKE
jgi:molybdopterin-guanine dinucleotide biosynthesis protein A